MGPAISGAGGAAGDRGTASTSSGSAGGRTGGTCMRLIRNEMPNVWQARWIDPELPHDPEERQPSSVLRRRFAAEGAEGARLFITCHGLYEAYLNGQRVGDFVLAPGTGDYTKRLTVQCYD
ncbi:MAG: alpha-L-rhamnosidase N-terminal domain-containing protein, partial [Lachnospiraceae bacterium]|nr:alpha-L-rhamnosidase N-terminal domain-containing protein [Lachnospiraceae bacterium]